MSSKRRVVRLVNAVGSATLVYEDGTQEHHVFSGQDVTLMEHDPMGRCQRCGDAAADHGYWAYDGEDEFWEPTSCTECAACLDYVAFTPWNEGKP